MRRLLTLLLLLAALPAHAEEAEAFSKVSALQGRLLAFLCGAQPPGPSRESIPGLSQPELPPTWLVHWQATLLRDLLHDPSHSRHPLLTATLPVVQLRADKPSAEPIVAAPLPAELLTCPRDASLRLHVQVLHPGDDVTAPWLGIDLACVDGKPSLQRQIRLLVQTNPQGQVLRASGVAWLQPVALTSQTDPQAAPDYVLHPTLLDKRFAWLVALPTGGWLAQLQALPTVGWQTDTSALPRFDEVASLTDTAVGDAQRYTLLLADDGAPRAALLHGPLGDGRQPLWREGAWDIALPQDGPADPLRTLILQRVARPAAHDGTQVGRAWTHASYALWQVTRDAVRAVELPLVPLEDEGVWDCDGEPPLARLHCAFRRLGPRSDSVTDKRQFALIPGANAAFRLLSVSELQP